jgi:tetratricopeptide (TPR) repeat protein
VQNLIPGAGLAADHKLFFPHRGDSAYLSRHCRFFRKGLAMNMTLAFRRLGILAVAALLVTALGMKPLHAMGTNNPPPPTDDGNKKKKKNNNNVIEQQQQQQAAAEFLRDYRAAREMILAGNYQGGIAAMHALGHDEHPDVANYIGYAYRKMGDYKDSQIWYEAALKADPNHVRTWSYYGMWQMEQGNRLKALDDLQKVNLICGNTTCEEYRQLKAVIDGKASY